MAVVVSGVTGVKVTAVQLPFIQAEVLSNDVKFSAKVVVPLVIPDDAPSSFQPLALPR